ncbi:MAG: hypothetical protein JXB49_31550 [Bacteroidales bacterium]|nr:hypothetical protein [Bacteroidales bacterium]
MTTNKCKKTILKVLLYVFISFILLITLQRIPISVDYVYYSESTRSFLEGTSRLYDANTNSYYYMPWGMLITIPLSYLPDVWGQAMLNILSLSGILVSMNLLVDSMPGWGNILVLVNLYTLNMMFSGQWDGISVGACAFAWWCVEKRRPLILGLAILLLTTKPTNTIIVLLLLSIHLIRQWNFSDMLQTMLLPLVVLVTSFFFCGIDWPLRYIQFIQLTPPLESLNLSLWKETSLLSLLLIFGVIIWFSIIVWRKDINQLILSFALLVNLIISPYVLSYHFVGSSPALGWLAKKHWGYAFIPWGLMIYHFVAVTDLLPTPHFIFYPLSILVLCVFVWRGELFRTPQVNAKFSKI